MSSHSYTSGDTRLHTSFVSPVLLPSTGSVSSLATERIDRVYRVGVPFFSVLPNHPSTFQHTRYGFPTIRLGTFSNPTLTVLVHSQVVVAPPTLIGPPPAQ